MGREKTYETDVIEQTLDAGGNAVPYPINVPVHHLLYKNRFRLRLILISVKAVSEVRIDALNRTRNRAHLYDRDKQGWLIASDIDNGHFLHLRLYYTDIKHVPRQVFHKN